MDSGKCSAQVERFEVDEIGRRRRWTDHEKLKIVLENLQIRRQRGIRHLALAAAELPAIIVGPDDS